MQIKTLLCMLLLSLCSIAATAQTDGDFTFAINENAATLTAYTGAGGAVTIPDTATIEGTKYPVTAIGRYAFYQLPLISVEIPNSVTTIEYSAFMFCNDLMSVILGNSVETIGQDAFAHCSALTSVILPNSLTSIESYAFHECHELTSVTIGNSLTSIGESAFRGCSSLKLIEIPNSVTAIEKYAFALCFGLIDIYVFRQTPLDIPENVFLALPLEEITLHVPEGTEAAYRAANPWKDF
ncbi:MAG: leucine-rich repeat domain-containing protein, partial [Tannerella sp.]|nr:leucine-rich repeat domain-containing protein [Tannerella sp.]